MKYSKTVTFLGSLILATGVTLAGCLVIVISRLLNLLPFPWGEIANIAYAIIILTVVIYILISKVTKDKE